MPIIIGIIIAAVVVALVVVATGAEITVTAGFAAAVILGVFVVVAAVVVGIMGGTTSDSPTGTITQEMGQELIAEMTCAQATEVVDIITQSLTDAEADRDQKQDAYDKATEDANKAAIAVGICALAVAALSWNPIGLAIAVIAFAAASTYLASCNRKKDNAAADLTQANNAVALLEQQVAFAQAIKDLVCNRKTDTPVRLLPPGFVVLPPYGAVLPSFSKDSCQVRIADGKVTSSGACIKNGICTLYARKKGRRGQWERQEQGVKQDLGFEYRCFCHHPKK